MSSPFVAEIRMFGCDFAPAHWAHCNGQRLPIGQNTALFSLLGTAFGGDGKSTFALPDFQGSIPIHFSSDYPIGTTGGTPAVTLPDTGMPVHTHNVMVHADRGDSDMPEPFVSLAATAGAAYATARVEPVISAHLMITPTGESAAHNNLQPYLVVNFCIAMQGDYPARP